MGSFCQPRTRKNSLWGYFTIQPGPWSVVVLHTRWVYTITRRWKTTTTNTTNISPFFHICHVKWEMDDKDSSTKHSNLWVDSGKDLREARDGHQLTVIIIVIDQEIMQLSKDNNSTSRVTRGPSCTSWPGRVC